MDLIIVTTIYQLLNGLERAITKESLLHKRLQNELILKNVANNLLKQSEEHYKTLFSQSPLSICIYDRESLRFLQVNEAATLIYDYTEEEFLNMHLTEIQSPEDLTESHLAILEKPIKSDFLNHEIALHVKKEGEPIHVEIKSVDFVFQGKQARLMIATDITQKVNHIMAIKEQNERLKQIAHLQSHVIRVPLANIMGLSGLIMAEITSESQRELFNYLNISVKKLDRVIRDIVNHKS